MNITLKFTTISRTNLFLNIYRQCDCKIHQIHRNFDIVTLNRDLFDTIVAFGQIRDQRKYLYERFVNKSL